MTERLTQITVLPKGDEWGDLQPGQMRLARSPNPNLWGVCCPVCGTLGELRTHQITEHDDGTVTVSPSLVCNGSTYREPDHYDRCSAHYFINHNQIQWV